MGETDGETRINTEVGVGKGGGRGRKKRGRIGCLEICIIREFLYMMNLVTVNNQLQGTC